MFGPDVTFLGVEGCDLEDAAQLEGADAVIIGAPSDAGAGTAPGTGTPEPGGLAGRQLLDAVRRIAIELPVVGIDVVEVSPPYDTAEITAFLANRVVLELSGIAYRRRGGTWDSIPKTLLEGRT
jgi:arginase family protein